MMRQKGFYKCPTCGSTINKHRYEMIMQHNQDEVCAVCGLEMKHWEWVVG